MKVCLVYDCLFPWTIGGAERWYRNLSERLAAEGHDVTYLTLTQWRAGEEPRLPGVRVLAVGPLLDLYTGERRRIGPPLRFGWGVFAHLLHQGRRYDVVHAASFPFFSLLAIGLVRPFCRFKVVCDWHEVWSRDYWISYLGPVGGRIGFLIQRLCALVPQQAYTFSRLHADRLRKLGLNGSVTALTGEYAGQLEAAPPVPATYPPTVVYAGRLIPEKRVSLLIDALPEARKLIPNLQARIFGRGPELERLRAQVAGLGLGDAVSFPGFVPSEEIVSSMAEALCVVQPSSREGYGMVVVEASALGVPVVVVAGEDNAAVELIEDGENGFVAEPAEPAALADRIVRCWREGEAMRERTRNWYSRNAVRLSLAHSLSRVAAGYAAATGAAVNKSA